MVVPVGSTKEKDVAAATFPSTFSRLQWKLHDCKNGWTTSTTRTGHRSIGYRDLVCSQHFNDCCFNQRHTEAKDNNGKEQKALLKWDAIPTIFPSTPSHHLHSCGHRGSTQQSGLPTIHSQPLRGSPDRFSPEIPESVAAFRISKPKKPEETNKVPYISAGIPESVSSSEMTNSKTPTRSAKFAKKRKTSDEARLTFSELTNILDFQPDEVIPPQSSHTSWKRLVDSSEHLMVFYQVDYLQASPNISRCVRIRRERSDTNEERLIPAVFLNQNLQSTYVLGSTLGLRAKDLLGRKYLMSYEELTSLLDHLELENGGRECGTRNTYDGFGSDGEEEHEELFDSGDVNGHDDGYFQQQSPLPLTIDEESIESNNEFEFYIEPSTSTSDGPMELQPEPQPEMDVGREVADTVLREPASSVSPENPTEKRKSRKNCRIPIEMRVTRLRSIRPKTELSPPQWDEPPTITKVHGVVSVAAALRPSVNRKNKKEAQMELLESVRSKMSTPGSGRVELTPGSGRYISEEQLTAIQVKLTKPHRTPLTIFRKLVIAFVGGEHKAVQLFSGSGFGLRTALGMEFIADIVGWVNSNHPRILSGKYPRLTCSPAANAFSKRMHAIRLKFTYASGKFSTNSTADDDSPEE